MPLRSRFLLQSLFSTFVAPLVVCYLVTRPWNLPASLKACIYTASIPVFDFVCSARKKRKIASDCAALGAKPIPRVKGKLPGNIDVLWKLVTSGSTEYCSDSLREWAVGYGPTFDMNILWAHQVSFIQYASLS